MLTYNNILESIKWWLGSMNSQILCNAGLQKLKKKTEQEEFVKYKLFVKYSC
jgi:hypothetical protein